MAKRDMKEQSWWVNFKSGGYKAAGYYFCTKILFPFGFPALAVFFGWVSNASLFYIWVGFLLSLASVFVTLVMYREWRYRIRVEDKLAFSDVNFGWDMHADGLVMGVILRSIADFPIEFAVEKVEARISNTVASGNASVGRQTTVPPFGHGWANDGPIHLTNSPTPGTMEGSLEFDIKYGKKGGPLKYRISGKKQVVCVFNEFGSFEVGHWHDAV